MREYIDLLENFFESVSNDDTAEHWVVSKKGSYSGGFEIAVVNSSNKLGLESYGWFGPEKILISSGPHGESTTERVWNGLIDLANTVCTELNHKSA